MLFRSESDAGAVIKLALEFVILTACRTSEVLGARWTEVDLDTATWTIPGARMKRGKEHRVPLAPRCIEILSAAKEFGGEYVFPGRKPDVPLSNMAFLMVLRRMGVEATVHGFRSSFRDWTSEETNTPREVAEQALSHAIGNAVEAAYRRGDLLEKREKLMQGWAAFCRQIGHPANVISLARAKG